MKMMKAWLEAFRLRTLPLAAATVITGAIPSIHAHAFELSTFLLVLFTTFSLQILSNLANDYGDYKKGTDNRKRLGPERTLQSGRIKAVQMKRMIYVFVGLSILSGLILLFLALGVEKLLSAFILLSIGLFAIWAAIKYTVGKNAFGYRGLGDVFVFLFFGLVGVCGTSFLITETLDISVIVLAFTPGLLASGVLNVNNMRDIKNDRESGKNTLVVKVGIVMARRYHLALIILGLMMTSAYFVLNMLPWINVLVFALLPLFGMHLKSIFSREGKALDPQLKVLSLSSFAFSVLHFVLAFLSV